MAAPQAGSPAGPGNTIVRRGQDRVRAVSIPATAVSQQLISMGGVLVGWCLRETTGAAAAVVELYDGTGTGGTRVCSVGMPQGSGSTQWLGPNGLDVESGLYASLVAGTAEITVYYRFDITGGA